MERPGATTMKGNPLTLIGPELQVGDHAPDFSVVDGTLSPVNLEKTGSHVRIISVVPSLDTPVCDLQTKRFNEEAAQLPLAELVIYYPSLKITARDLHGGTIVYLAPQTLSGPVKQRPDSFAL